jgi:hypothetical protein
LGGAVESIEDFGEAVEVVVTVLGDVVAVAMRLRSVNVEYVALGQTHRDVAFRNLGWCVLVIWIQFVSTQVDRNAPYATR